MAKINIGKLGEEIIYKWLQVLSYKIIAERWRCRQGEIDLIAQKNRTNNLVFVEVKTRTSTTFGQPEEFVTPQKETLITTAAHAYIDEIDHDWEVRFDIIAIVYRSAADYEFRHYEDAFFPGL